MIKSLKPMMATRDLNFSFLIYTIFQPEAWQQTLPEAWQQTLPPAMHAGW
jgi:hypothetical protein